MATIVTLTPNPAIDLSTSVDRIAPTLKLRCRAPRRDPGGGGINVARVVKRLGGDVEAIFPAGGFTGRLLHRCSRSDWSVVVFGLRRPEMEPMAGRFWERMPEPFPRP